MTLAVKKEEDLLRLLFPLTVSFSASGVNIFLCLIACTQGMQGYPFLVLNKLTPASENVEESVATFPHRD